MKKNRNMFYTNNQSGGFFNPTPNNMMPSGYNQNLNYMAYGPNVGPNGVIAPVDQGYGYPEENDIENRISSLERQVRKLETRVSKLESVSDIVIDDSTNNMYMI